MTTRLRSLGSTTRIGRGGPVPPGLAIVIGVGLSLVGLFAMVLGVVGGDHARVARIVCGALFVAMGAVVVRMGTARRAWQRRHPGVDPVVVARELRANVGDPLGNDSVGSRIGRWVLVGVCAFVVFICVLAVDGIATGRSPGSVGSVAVTVLLGLVAAAVGVAPLGRRRHRRR